MSIPLKHLDDKALVGMFVNGLDEKVRGRLLKMNCNGFLDVMTSTEKIKEANVVIKLAQELDKSKTIKITHITWNPPNTHTPNKHTT